MGNPIKNVRRAVDAEDATREQRAVEKIKEQIKAYARSKKKQKKESKEKTMEDQLFGNKEI
jgi:hypothetical protein